MATGSKWVNNGQAFAVDQLDKNTASGTPTYFGAWGSGSTTPTVGDTALGSENAESRTSIVAGSMSQPATDTVQWIYAITATGSRTVQETGIFSASSAGTMYIRIVHGSLSLESGDIVTYTVTLQLKDTSE